MAYAIGGGITLGQAGSFKVPQLHVALALYANGAALLKVEIPFKDAFGFFCHLNFAVHAIGFEPRGGVYGITPNIIKRFLRSNDTRDHWP